MNFDSPTFVINLRLRNWQRHRTMRYLSWIVYSKWSKVSGVNQMKVREHVKSRVVSLTSCVPYGILEYLEEAASRYNCCLFDLTLGPEDESRIFLCNIGKLVHGVIFQKILLHIVKLP